MASVGFTKFSTLQEANQKLVNTFVRIKVGGPTSHQIGIVQSVDVDRDTVSPNYGELVATVNTSSGFAVKCAVSDLRRAFLVIVDLNGVLGARASSATAASGGGGGGGSSNSNTKMFLQRPHLETFLPFLFKNFVVAVWTSSLETNGRRVIDEVFGARYSKRLVFQWFRDQCTPMETFFRKQQQQKFAAAANGGGAAGGQPGMLQRDPSLDPSGFATIKELTAVWEKFPSFDHENTIIIDDSPAKCSHPMNSLCPPQFLWNSSINAVVPPGSAAGGSSTLSVGKAGAAQVYMSNEQKEDVGLLKAIELLNKVLDADSFSILATQDEVFGKETAPFSAASGPVTLSFVTPMGATLTTTTVLGIATTTTLQGSQVPLQETGGGAGGSASGALSAMLRPSTTPGDRSRMERQNSGTMGGMTKSSSNSNMRRGSETVTEQKSSPLPAPTVASYDPDQVVANLDEIIAAAFKGLGSPPLGPSAPPGPLTGFNRPPLPPLTQVHEGHVRQSSQGPGCLSSRHSPSGELSRLVGSFPTTPVAEQTPSGCMLPYGAQQPPPFPQHSSHHHNQHQQQGSHQHQQPLHQQRPGGGTVDPFAPSDPIASLMRQLSSAQNAKAAGTPPEMRPMAPTAALLSAQGAKTTNGGVSGPPSVGSRRCSPTPGEGVIQHQPYGSSQPEFQTTNDLYGSADRLHSPGMAMFSAQRDASVADRYSSADRRGSQDGGTMGLGSRQESDSAAPKASLYYSDDDEEDLHEHATTTPSTAAMLASIASPKADSPAGTKKAKREKRTKEEKAAAAAQQHTTAGPAANKPPMPTPKARTPGGEQLLAAVTVPSPVPKKPETTTAVTKPAGTSSPSPAQETNVLSFFQKASNGQSGSSHTASPVTATAPSATTNSPAPQGESTNVLTFFQKVPNGRPSSGNASPAPAPTGPALATAMAANSNTAEPQGRAANVLSFFQKAPPNGQPASNPTIAQTNSPVPQGAPTNVLTFFQKANSGQASPAPQPGPATAPTTQETNVLTLLRKSSSSSSPPTVTAGASAAGKQPFGSSPPPEGGNVMSFFRNGNAPTTGVPPAPAPAPAPVSTPQNGGGETNVLSFFKGANVAAVSTSTAPPPPPTAAPQPADTNVLSLLKTASVKKHSPATMVAPSQQHLQIRQPDPSGSPMVRQGTGIPDVGTRAPSGGFSGNVADLLKAGGSPKGPFTVTAGGR